MEYEEIPTNIKFGMQFSFKWFSNHFVYMLVEAIIFQMHSFASTHNWMECCLCSKNWKRISPVFVVSISYGIKPKVGGDNIKIRTHHTYTLEWFDFCKFRQIASSHTRNKANETTKPPLFAQHLFPPWTIWIETFSEIPKDGK